MNKMKERTSNRIKRKKDEEDYFVQSSCFWYYVRTTTIMIKFGRRHGPFFRHEINNTKKGSSSSGNVARKRINEFLCGSLVNDR